jgi:hypothetical protein
VIGGDTALTLPGIGAALRADVHASLSLPMTRESIWPTLLVTLVLWTSHDHCEATLQLGKWDVLSA